MSLTNYKPQTMITVMLLIAGLLCYWLFYKTIDWFEKI